MLPFVKLVAISAQNISDLLPVLVKCRKFYRFASALLQQTRHVVRLNSG